MSRLTHFNYFIDSDHYIKKKYIILKKHFDV